MISEPQPVLSTHSYKLREGIDRKLPAFADHTSSTLMQERIMNAIRRPEAIQGIASNPREITNTGPSLQCAALLFIASLSSFIGAALLLASI
jgi:hypothetical protein